MAPRSLLLIPALLRMNLQLQILLLVCSFVFTASVASSARRCVARDADNRLTLSRNCERCSFRYPAEENVPLAMIVIASDTPTQSSLLTIASQCIAADFNVVVVYVTSTNSKQEDDTMELMLERKITSWTLCVEPLLSFHKVMVEDIHDDSLLKSPYDANALRGAEAEHDALDEMLVETGVLPDVMVVCISHAYVGLVCSVSILILLSLCSDCCRQRWCSACRRTTRHSKCLDGPRQYGQPCR